MIKFKISYEGRMGGDNVYHKCYDIVVDGVVRGSIDGQVRDVFQSYTNPNYSAGAHVTMEGVEKNFNSHGWISSKREADSRRAEYIRMAKEWVIKNLQSGAAA